MTNEFKYDVAFSFHKDDEAVAAALDDLLSGRLSTFLYSKQQEKLAGNNGVEVFTEVFGKQARVVIILYRNEWGQTPWTRVEQDVICNRMLEQGHDFYMLVPTMSGQTLPRWVPKSEIYLDLERFGIEKAAAIIEYKVQEAGGRPKVETAIERTARLKRQMDAETERRAFLTSIHGVNQARQTTLELFNEIAALTNKICAETQIEINLERSRETRPGLRNYWLEIRGGSVSLAVDWNCRYANTLDDSGLMLVVWGGTPARIGRMFFQEPPVLDRKEFTFDRDQIGVFGWREKRGGRVLEPRQMAEFCVNHFMDHLHRKHMKK